MFVFTGSSYVIGHLIQKNMGAIACIHPLTSIYCHMLISSMKLQCTDDKYKQPLQESSFGAPYYNYLHGRESK
jgi:hypothetical protein